MLRGNDLSNMHNDTIEALRQTVEGLHQCKAVFEVWASVRENYLENLVWSGRVGVFALVDHPTATRAYAWSSPIEGSEKRKFYAVLHEGPVKSPADAVRAAIVKDYQESEEK